MLFVETKKENDIFSQLNTMMSSILGNDSEEFNPSTFDFNNINFEKIISNSQPIAPSPKKSLSRFHTPLGGMTRFPLTMIAARNRRLRLSSLFAPS